MTSFWCEGWGMSASAEALDFEFKYVQEKLPFKGGVEHGRSWR